MAFRHYGGKAPEPLQEWDCPSCGVANTGPLKAGCQACGAGNDARKVELPPRGVLQGAAKAAVIAKVTAVAAAESAQQAWNDWASTQASAEVNWDVVKGAFMAGVAWAQEQPVAAERAAMTAAGFPIPTATTSLVTGQEYLYLTEQGDLPDTSLRPEVHATILAALAFYRDNALAYGPVPGQLAAEQVTELIARLRPQEPEV